MIETYLSSGFEWKLARDVSHYDPWVVKNILRSHHYNAFVVIIVSFASLFFFGSFIENPFFRIPAASSVCLLFTTTMVIMAGLSYFFGDWRFLFIIAFILSLNYFSQFVCLPKSSSWHGLSTPATTLQPIYYRSQCYKK